MVASQQEEVLRVFDLIRQKQTDCLETLLSSVHVVTQKQVVRLRGKPSVFEQSQQVVILPVDIPYENNEKTVKKDPNRIF